KLLEDKKNSRHSEKTIFSVRV
ncbi:uncharacterized protein METZ01_LOCUS369010, partial [marine metagenome]